MANVFTTAGANLDADIIDGTAASPGATGWYVGWGTGAGTAVVGNTALNTEASEARVQVVCSQPSANINKFLGTITCAGAGKTITNAGIFNASTTGTLYMHSDFTGIALAVGDKIEFDFQLSRS